MIKHEEMKKELDTIYNKPFDLKLLHNLSPQFLIFQRIFIAPRRKERDYRKH